MKTNCSTFLIFLLLNLSQFHFSNGQNSDLVGIVGNNLIQIDSLTGTIQVLTTINNIAAGDHINLTYHSQQNVYYTILDSYNVPKLVSISKDGDYEIIGTLTFNGIPIPLLDALAYNPVNNKLYAGVSLNGGTSQNDFFSESIVEINILNGVCTLVSNISTNLSPADIDVMAFEGNILYIFDGNPPSLDLLYFYKLDFNNIGLSSFPQLIYQSTYINIQDFTISNNNIYITEGRNLIKYNINQGILNFIGSTHSSAEFNGLLIRGISNAYTCSKPVVNLGENIISCINDPVILETTTCDECIYKWNDGSTENTIIVTETGEYWVEVENQCGINKDSIFVTLENPLEINLGDDRTICGESVLLLDTTNFNGALFEWQDGSTQASFLVVESGSYWVSGNNSCGSSSDTITITLQTLPNINLGDDRVLCSNDPVVINVACIDCIYKWNNGSTESSLTTNQSGVFLVEVENICGKAQDSLSLQFIIDRPFIPNLFTPNGDNWNQFFEIDSNLLGASLKVFNRWGKLVYESQNYLGDWDANDIASGIYYYAIVDKFCKRQYKGTITIMH